MIHLAIEAADGPAELAFAPTTLIIAGWTGRDPAILQAHIDELAELGVAPPKAVPMFYRVDAALLTSAPMVQMVGTDGSGEVEAVLWKSGGELYVGIGSDHTDRKLEAIGITLSKQVCAKPVSPRVWRWRDVADHWDAVMLRSTVDGGDIYQEGPTTALRRPDVLLALYEEREGPVPDGTVMFCGTLPVHGGIRFADTMTLELQDPVLGRTLSHPYSVDVLPIAEQ